MKIMSTAYAFDATARTTDTDGRLHISKSHISKATVNPYYGKEIPNYEKLGLDPNRIYYMFRDPVELARGASTFARLPILSKHVPISSIAPRQDLQVGTIGSNVEFNDPYLDADVCIWAAGAIAGIETEQVREFSCAYHYVAVMTPGEYHGQRYDGIMTEIRGNHLALVEAGRAGSDVLAADEEIKPMAKTTKLGKALIVTLGGMSPKLAQDSATFALVGMAKKKTFNSAKVSEGLIALDAELDPKKLTAAFDALLALDADKEDKPAQDEDDEDDITGDEDEDEDDKKKRLAKDAEEKAEKDKTAMDAAIASATAKITQNIQEANEARQLVRPVVGDVIGMDSAPAIYGYALDHMKVERAGVEGTPALRAMFKAVNTRSAAPAPRIAQDSADSLVAVFGDDVTRFRTL